MSKKMLDFYDDVLILFGIYLAIRFIYTKEVYIQMPGFTVNTLSLLLLTILTVSVPRLTDKNSSKKTKSIK
jgi:hypothetical protein